MTDEDHAVVLLSGGLDSAACAALLLRATRRVRALFVDYGQAARIHELSAARAVAKHYSVHLDEVVVSGMATADGEIPGRNAFLVCAGVLASSGRALTLAIAIHKGTPYFDCSLPFLHSIRSLAAECTDGRVQVVAPFVDWTKCQIFDYCITNAVPIHLTYSCERGELPECGKCLSCGDRARLRSPV
jgi:7-cyano-7-deazaguanine synthase